MAFPTATAALSVIQAAQKRRSIRQFAPEPVDRGDLEEILRVTSLAPSSMNLQPWRFVVVESPEGRVQMAHASGQQRQVLSAPAIIVLYTDMADALAHVDELVHPNIAPEKRPASVEKVLKLFRSKTTDEREAYGAAQGYIALGYLLLAAESLGYQTSPMLGFDAAKVRDALALPEHARIPALVAIGRGAEEGYPHHRHALSRIVRYA